MYLCQQVHAEQSQEVAFEDRPARVRGLFVRDEVLPFIKTSFAEVRAPASNGAESKRIVQPFAYYQRVRDISNGVSCGSIDLFTQLTLKLRYANVNPHS